jgi:signal recognition particle receptor subunit beta
MSFYAKQTQCVKGFSGFSMLHDSNLWLFGTPGHPPISRRNALQASPVLARLQNRFL